MTKVFIGGSRRITRLNAQIRRRLDRIIEKSLPVVIGDANGADKAVQQYLRDRGYDQVEVFCSNGVCRNNLGGWATRPVPVPKGPKDFQFYSAKDRQMAKEATVGFMLWDGRSRGTLENILNLLEMKKKVVVYFTPTKEFVTLKDKKALAFFTSHHEVALHGRPRRSAHSLKSSDRLLPAATLF